MERWAVHFIICQDTRTDVLLLFHHYGKENWGCSPVRWTGGASSTLPTPVLLICKQGHEVTPTRTRWSVLRCCSKDVVCGHRAHSKLTGSQRSRSGAWPFHHCYPVDCQPKVCALGDRGGQGFFFLFFSLWHWSIIVSQCHVNFGRAVKSISYMYTYIPTLLDLPPFPWPHHPTHLGHYEASQICHCIARCARWQLPTGCLFDTW